MNIKRCFVGLIAGGLILGLAGLSPAAPVYWADWVQTTAGAPVGVAGTISGPGFDTVEINYTGLFVGVQLDETGANYWSPESTFADGATVDNGPPLKDIIKLNGGGATVHTVTFSEPVVNPVMGIVSLGQSGLPVIYDFDAVFEIVSNGPGTFGNGPLDQLVMNVLEGREGHGTIMFPGTFQSISWTIPNAEYWHGITIGIGGVEGGPNGIPAPGAMLLAGLGTGLIGLLRRRGTI